MLHPGAVVPAAVQQHDLASGRKVRHITLEVPLRAFAVGWLGQGNGTAHARVERAGDGGDDTPLARRVAAFDDHQEPLTRVLQPARHIVELHLQWSQFFKVFTLAQLARLGLVATIA